MASYIAALALDAHDPALLAEFWCQVLGWQVVEIDTADDVDPPDVSIGPADGAGHPLGPTIDFLHTTDVKAQKLRLHIDLRAGDRDQAAELQRLLALGARPVDIGQGPEVSWHVLADPEGNEFCLLRDR